MVHTNSKNLEKNQAINLLGLTRDELDIVIRSLGEPINKSRMRTKQLWHWIYFQGVNDFNKMTTLGETLRNKLKEKYIIQRQ